MIKGLAPTAAEPMILSHIGAMVRRKGAALLGVATAVVLVVAACGGSSGSDSAGEGEGEGDGGEAGESAAQAEDDLGFSELSNGHQHDQGVEPLSEEEEAELAKQLAPTEDLMEQYPTLADAEAAGYIRAGPFAPGLGTHYMEPFGESTSDTEWAPGVDEPLLIYDGIDPDSKLAGFMFMAMGDEEPEGFAGPNDHWHYHEKVCVKFGGENGVEVPFGADRQDVTEEMCDNVDGTFIDFTGYMVHVWNVPGYESPEGLFHELNSKITCPDGTYYRLPEDEQGAVDSICRNA